MMNKRVQWMGGPKDGDYISVPEGLRQVEIPILPDISPWNPNEDTEIREVKMKTRTVPVKDFWDTNEVRPVLDWYSGSDNANL